MFAAADLVVVNKTDLLPYVDFDIDGCRRTSRRSNREAGGGAVGHPGRQPRRVVRLAQFVLGTGCRRHTWYRSAPLTVDDARITRSARR